MCIIEKHVLSRATTKFSTAESVPFSLKDLERKMCTRPIEQFYCGMPCIDRRRRYLVDSKTSVIHDSSKHKNKTCRLPENPGHPNTNYYKRTEHANRFYKLKTKLN